MFEIKASDSVVIGLKQSLKMLEANKVKAAYMAEDVDYPIASRLMDACRKSGVEVNRVESKARLGKECHLDVAASIVCILK